MTAEIAIINKSAIALAADSAVTITTGTRQEKIFDTADKLFELCDHNPIGIMIYNGMSFAGTPLPSLIKLFRTKSCGYDKVEVAASAFLEFLQNYGASAPESAKNSDAIHTISRRLLKIRQEAADAFEKELGGYLENNKNPTQKGIAAFGNSIIKRLADEYIIILKKQDDALFMDGDFTLTEKLRSNIVECISRLFPDTSKITKNKLFQVSELLLSKSVMSDSATGIVIAGFGTDEIFPTLVSFEVDGIIGSKLKYIKTNHVDIDIIDGSTSRATVIPFAQKEMVERFLYGLDEKIQTDIADFCESTISSIAEKILEKIEFADPKGADVIQKVVEAAEAAFANGLKMHAFEAIRNRSRAQIEDMVEFMPKQELADMAEALVNLTSIKRRVSRGMETVGGPIDVAVISQSEGFVWVKRKHYFSPELNSRYFQRVERLLAHKMESAHAQNEKSR
ncbi:hypothetical protein [Blastochloris sulfoviridis]|uniref:Uncharacterized protein n=1 Tax=Blastochloris sulfoviridis TaxID=50712 RepID=A0A5M6I2F1_9HYPH|nr:hypothetical protein [Blastochloris sulfoviridis]KAA5602342.1 hypothetical protein F1193_05410 [Blastochloris sulfoviridis]